MTRKCLHNAKYDDCEKCQEIVRDRRLQQCKSRASQTAELLPRQYCSQISFVSYLLHLAAMQANKSIGIISYRVFGDSFEYLMVQKRDTWNYESLIRGCNIYTTSLWEFWTHLTLDEQHNIVHVPFQKLWNRFWNHKKPSAATFEKVLKKIKKLKPFFVLFWNRRNALLQHMTCNPNFKLCQCATVLSKSALSHSFDADFGTNCNQIHNHIPIHTHSILPIVDVRHYYYHDDLSLLNNDMSTDASIHRVKDSFCDRGWSFPKGRQHLKESIWTTALREWYEETRIPIYFLIPRVELGCVQEVFHGTDQSLYETKFLICFVPSLQTVNYIQCLSMHDKIFHISCEGEIPLDQKNQHSTGQIHTYSHSYHTMIRDDQPSYNADTAQSMFETQQPHCIAWTNCIDSKKNPFVHASTETSQMDDSAENTAALSLSCVSSKSNHYRHYVSESRLSLSSVEIDDEPNEPPGNINHTEDTQPEQSVHQTRQTHESDQRQCKPCVRSVKAENRITVQDKVVRLIDSMRKTLQTPGHYGKHDEIIDIRWFSIQQCMSNLRSELQKKLVWKLHLKLSFSPYPSHTTTS